jgi:hypothetical protein
MPLSFIVPSNDMMSLDIEYFFDPWFFCVHELVYSPKENLQQILFLSFNS